MMWLFDYVMAGGFGLARVVEVNAGRVTVEKVGGDSRLTVDVREAKRWRIVERFVQTTEAR